MIGAETAYWGPGYVAPILQRAWDTCLELKAGGEDMNEAATEADENDHASQD
jgi:hypothetical protein